MTSPGREGGSLAAAAFRGLRPRQWVKNVLVVAAPAAAGELTDPAVLSATAVAFVAFCLASSAVYLANDVVDREADRLHPVKRHRPIASGELPVGVAVGLSVVLVVAALAVAATMGLSFLLLVACYLLLQVAYIWRLKHEPVLDLAAVALGFLLRGVAGGVAAGIEVSDWFLMVAGFGSLYIVAAKRYSEFRTIGSAAGTRRSLARYSESYLRFVWSMAAASTVVAYSLWAFEMSESASDSWPWHALSVLPFVVGIMRYAVDVDSAAAAEPEDIVFRDRGLQVIGLVWVVVLALGVFDV